MLEGIIKKLQIILALCLVIALLLFYTPLGDLINGEVEKKVKEFKEETKEKIDAKKEEVKEAIDWTKASNREWGTDELRKHTEDVTPGQEGEWSEAVNAKNKSMREALAKVWDVDEGKSPFKKENKKDVSKKGKAMTGGKIAKVDTKPTING